MQEKAAKENNVLIKTIKIQILPIFSKVIFMAFQFENGDMRCCSPKTVKSETAILIHVKVLKNQNRFVCLHNLNQLYDIKAS